MGMERPFHIDFLATLCSTFNYLQIPCERFSFLIVHYSRPFVANPGMCSSSPRIDPHDMLESKIFSQRCINDLDGHCDEGPAFVADVCFSAAGTYLVVIRQIYVKDQLFSHWPKSCGFAETFAIPRICCIDRAYLEPGRVEANNVPAEATRCEHCDTRKHNYTYRSPVAKLWYLRYASFCRVNANSR